MWRSIAGREGRISVGRMVAATLGRWMLVPSEDRPHAYVLDAELRAADEFWITCHPQAVELVVGAATWIWDRVEVEYSGSWARAVMGAEQRRR